jgi:hypothetical protein
MSDLRSAHPESPPSVLFTIPCIVVVLIRVVFHFSVEDSLACLFRNLSEDPTQSSENKNGCAQGHSPTRGCYIPKGNPELQHHPEDSNVATDLQYRPETPVKLDEIFAVAIFNVE